MYSCNGHIRVHNSHIFDMLRSHCRGVASSVQYLRRPSASKHDHDILLFRNHREEEDKH